MCKVLINEALDSGEIIVDFSLVSQKSLWIEEKIKMDDTFANFLIECWLVKLYFY